MPSVVGFSFQTIAKSLVRISSHGSVAYVTFNKYSKLA
jgi:hypothetical protein